MINLTLQLGNIRLERLSDLPRVTGWYNEQDSNLVAASKTLVLSTTTNSGRLVF